MDERPPSKQRIAAPTGPSHRARTQALDNAEAPRIGGIFAVLEAVVLASPSIDPASDPATETITGRVVTVTERARGGDT